MRRVLALVGAAAMIGAALWVRGVVEDDGDDGREEDETVIGCVDELDDVCVALAADGFDVRVVPAPVADMLEGRGDFDAWLAPTVWVELERAREDGRLGAPSRVIARSPVALVLNLAQDEPIREACTGDPTWTCIAAVDQPPVALVDPESGTGLPVLGAAAVGYFGTADFASNDLDAAFEDWLGGFVAGTEEAGDDPVGRMVTTRGLLSAAGAIEADAEAATLQPEQAEATAPPPASYADVVIAPVAGRMSDDARDQLTGEAALRRAFDEADGWTTSDMSDDDNQPSGGVLVALLDRWRELR
jgi:hypothetical protein